MKELVFIERNSERWKKVEQVLQKNDHLKPDTVSDLFIQITDDLAYARTYYPGSRVISYLNALAINIHHRIYRHKKIKTNQLSQFWRIDYPLLLKQCRPYILYSLIILLTGIGIGFLSASHDQSFTRLILGDAYVDKTLELIKNGDPLGIYKSTGSSSMFLSISINNIYVAFRCVIYGVFLSVGTAFMLLYNGIMVGSFQEFFSQHELLKTSVLTIYLHGTFELFAIVISGAAGFIIGSGIMFPGTYSRIQSFVQSVHKAMKLLLGIVPLIVLAAFLEGFVTRHSEWPDALKASIIVLSLLIIITYFFLYPNFIYQKYKSHG